LKENFVPNLIAANRPTFNETGCYLVIALVCKNMDKRVVMILLHFLSIPLLCIWS